MASKESKPDQWIVMSIPGDDERGDPTRWYAFNKASRQSVECADSDEARLVVRMLRGGAFLTA